MAWSSPFTRREGSTVFPYPEARDRKSRRNHGTGRRSGSTLGSGKARGATMNGPIPFQTQHQKMRADRGRFRMAKPSGNVCYRVSFRSTRTTGWEELVGIFRPGRRFVGTARRKIQAVGRYSSRPVRARSDAQRKTRPRDRAGLSFPRSAAISMTKSAGLPPEISRQAAERIIPAASRISSFLPSAAVTASAAGPARRASHAAGRCWRAVQPESAAAAASMARSVSSKSASVSARLG